jgi:hypothetical protein
MKYFNCLFLNVLLSVLFILKIEFAFGNNVQDAPFPLEVSKNMNATTRRLGYVDYGSIPGTIVSLAGAWAKDRLFYSIVEATPWLDFETRKYQNCDWNRNRKLQSQNNTPEFCNTQYIKTWFFNNHIDILMKYGAKYSVDFENTNQDTNAYGKPMSYDWKLTDGNQLERADHYFDSGNCMCSIHYYGGAKLSQQPSGSIDFTITAGNLKWYYDKLGWKNEWCNNGCIRTTNRGKIWIALYPYSTYKKYADDCGNRDCMCVGDGASCQI